MRRVVVLALTTACLLSTVASVLADVSRGGTIDVSKLKSDGSEVSCVECRSSFGRISLCEVHVVFRQCVCTCVCV